MQKPSPAMPTLTLRSEYGVHTASFFAPESVSSNPWITSFFSSLPAATAFSPAAAKSEAPAPTNPLLLIMFVVPFLFFCV